MFFDTFVSLIESISDARITCANPCAIEKKTATLICEASGLPAPKYLWFYGSVRFKFTIIEKNFRRTIDRRVRTGESKELIKA